MASTAEVLEHVRGRGFSDVDLRVEDMQCIMNALIYDGLIEEVPDANSTSKDAVLYKASGSIMQSNPFTEIPCATCPVRCFFVNNYSFRCLINVQTMAISIPRVVPI